MGAESAEKNPEKPGHEFALRTFYGIRPSGITVGISRIIAGIGLISISRPVPLSGLLPGLLILLNRRLPSLLRLSLRLYRLLRLTLCRLLILSRRFRRSRPFTDRRFRIQIETAAAFCAKNRPVLYLIPAMRTKHNIPPHNLFFIISPARSLQKRTRSA